jgi:hypothetical protein
LFEAPHPILNGPWSIPEELRDLESTHALGNEQQPVQAMIISGFRIPANLILQPENHGRGIGNHEWLHAPMKPQVSIMRNYLMRYV